MLLVLYFTRQNIWWAAPENYWRKKGRWALDLPIVICCWKHPPRKPLTTGASREKNVAQHNATRALCCACVQYFVWRKKFFVPVKFNPVVDCCPVDPHFIASAHLSIYTSPLLPRPFFQCLLFPPPCQMVVVSLLQLPFFWCLLFPPCQLIVVSLSQLCRFIHLPHRFLNSPVSTQSKTSGFLQLCCPQVGVAICSGLVQLFWTKQSQRGRPLEPVNNLEMRVPVVQNKRGGALGLNFLGLWFSPFDGEQELQWHEDAVCWRIKRTKGKTAWGIGTKEINANFDVN